MKPRVFVVQPAPPEPLEQLAQVADIDMFAHLDRRPSREEMAAGMAAADYVFALGENPIDAALIAASPKLRMIAVMEIFPVAIDFDAATARGIPVTGLPHSSEITDSTAEFTFGLITATAWRIPENDKLIRAGGWKQYQTRTLPTTRLRGKTLGIVGLGAIGRGVARMANAARMTLLYNDRTRFDAATEAEHQAQYRDLPALFSESDIVVLTPTLTETSKHLVGAGLIARMKPNALLINTSRGPVLDEAALVDALERGAIRGAGLDVYEHEFPGPNPGPDARLYGFDNVVLTPHIGTSSQETRRWMAETVVENIIAHMNGQEIKYLLNPEVRGGRKLVHDRIG